MGADNLVGTLNLSLKYSKDIDMRTFDFSPLYRSAIGYDRLANMVERAQRGVVIAKEPGVCRQRHVQGDRGLTVVPPSEARINTMQ